MEKLFRLKQNGTCITTELRAGLTTFVAMAYIIFLNPVFLSETGMSAPGVLAATCLSAALGTLLSAALSNKPFAMASGMGMNAYFTYTLCFGYGYTWQQALALTFLSGGVFLIVAVVAGKRAITFVPENLRHAIAAGIGLFLMLIGLLDAGIVMMTAGYPELGDLAGLPVLTALLGLGVMIVLTVLNVRGSLILGMLFTAAFSLVTKQTALPEHILAFPGALREVSFALDFRGLLSGGGTGAAAMSLIAVVISMSIVDMFDTLGFLIGTVSRTGEDGTGDELKKFNRVLIADAASTMVGAVCGTSTVTIYAESAAGVAAGGRTGLAALTTAGCFLLAVFFSPVASVFSSAVTAPALIVVGIYLLMDLRKIHFDSMDEVIPAVMTVSIMPFAYSITTGIAAGFLSYVLCKLAARKTRELTVSTCVLSAVFLVYFIMNGGSFTITLN